MMKFTGIALITEDVPRLAEFYEKIFNVSIERDPVHTLFQAGSLEVALYSKQAAERDMAFDFSRYGGTGRMTVSFAVPDVDAEYERLRGLGVQFVTSPKTYPWGTRSVHFRDPDGNIVCFHCRPGQ